MSHFTITVALPAEVPADKAALQEALETALAPFDENIEMDRYVSYTKEQLIVKAKENRENYKNGLYAQYLTDPAGYVAKCHNASHLEYISKAFPDKLTWDDERLYVEELKYYDSEDIGSEGEVYSTYNPQSKWDWWVVGGRWGGTWRFKSPVDYDYLSTDSSSFGMAEEAGKLLATDCGRIGDLAPEHIAPSFGYIALDGEWVEQGSMGWWGVSTADESETGRARWKRQYFNWIASLPKDAWIISVDCHI